MKETKPSVAINSFNARERLSVKESINNAIRDSLVISIDFRKTDEATAKRNGMEEGVVRLDIRCGIDPVLSCEVRANHGKKYAKKQKIKMIDALETARIEMQEAILTLKATIEEAPTASDDAE
jgi:hypothetical protein